MTGSPPPFALRAVWPVEEVGELEPDRVDNRLDRAAGMAFQEPLPSARLMLSEFCWSEWDGQMQVQPVALFLTPLKRSRKSIGLSHKNEIERGGERSQRRAV